jgi:hypothetical protein
MKHMSMLITLKIFVVTHHLEVLGPPCLVRRGWHMVELIYVLATFILNNNY